MRVAIEGCCHGELDSIYRTLEEADTQSGRKTDLLLICGDFQAIRCHADLQSLAVPEKYRELGDFHKYYSGESQAPVLTIIIGGNHEASNYMFELFHGGWVAPSIYFLGYAGSVIVNGLKISGASGIFKGKDYKKGFFETIPYDAGTMRSIYHIREFNVVRLAMLAHERPDIFLSHDWPLGIEQHGDLGYLKRTKPWFNAEIDRNELGSPPLFGLLKALAPPYWFAAHLHVKYAALYKHDGSPTTVVQQRRAAAAPEPKVAVEANADEIMLEIDDDAPPEAEDLASAKKAALALLDSDTEATDNSAPPLKAVPKNTVANEDEIVLELDDELDDIEEPKQEQPEPVAAQTHSTAPTSATTKFLALSKCTPRRDFLQIMDLDTPQADDTIQMTFDPLWLAIVRAFDKHMSFEERVKTPIPQDMAELKALVDESYGWVKTQLKHGGRIPVNEVQTFSQTAPSTATPSDLYEAREVLLVNASVIGMDADAGGIAAKAFFNPQTQAICDLLGIQNRLYQNGNAQ